ncbi:MAG: hypothetical protein EOP04_18415 [Proteobacteria bacterium]|nr:MAG: hypothetical protein EOP04_18415 [Pseudomonadota bacterium]
MPLCKMNPPCAGAAEGTFFREVRSAGAADGVLRSEYVFEELAVLVQGLAGRCEMRWWVEFIKSF